MLLGMLVCWGLWVKELAHTLGSSEGKKDSHSGLT